jgi:hypothetical protein
MIFHEKQEENSRTGVHIGIINNLANRAGKGYNGNITCTGLVTSSRQVPPMHHVYNRQIELLTETTKWGQIGKLGPQKLL